MTTGMTKRDRLIPWYFVLFFVVIALVDTVMVTLAVTTHTGTVTDHPYEKGLAYNKVVEAAQAQKNLGWKGQIDFKVTDGNSGVLTFTLTDESGAVIIPDSVKADFFRPAQAGMDFSIVLDEEKTSVEFPLPGLWEARIYAKKGKQTYQQAKRIVIQ